MSSQIYNIENVCFTFSFVSQLKLSTGVVTSLKLSLESDIQLSFNVFPGN